MSWFFYFSISTLVLPFDSDSEWEIDECVYNCEWEAETAATDKQRSDHLNFKQLNPTRFSSIFIMPSPFIRRSILLVTLARGNTINYADYKFTAKRLIKTHKKTKRHFTVREGQTEWDGIASAELRQVYVYVCVPASTAFHRCTMRTRARANGISSPMQTQTIFDVVCKFFVFFFPSLSHGKMCSVSSGIRSTVAAAGQRARRQHTQICGRRKTKYDKWYYFPSVHKRSWAHSPSRSFGPITLPLGRLSFMSSLNDYVQTHTLSLSYYYSRRTSISF